MMIALSLLSQRQLAMDTFKTYELIEINFNVIANKIKLTTLTSLIRLG
ncbi:MAG: hypothetical protein ACR5K4_00935 [Sodalis sp. (in: enterobacteria)]